MHFCSSTRQELDKRAPSTEGLGREFKEIFNSIFRAPPSSRSLYLLLHLSRAIKCTFLLCSLHGEAKRAILSRIYVNQAATYVEKRSFEHNQKPAKLLIN
jgi:hypothetical protein